MVEISYEYEWYTVLAIRIEKRSFGEQRMTKPPFSRNTHAIKNVSRFSRTTHERRSAGFPGRAWTVSNIKLSGREWIVSIYDESTLRSYKISCNDVCGVPSWPQRARQQTDHSYAAGLLGTEQRREISSRIKVKGTCYTTLGVLMVKVDRCHLVSYLGTFQSPASHSLSL